MSDHEHEHDHGLEHEHQHEEKSVGEKVAQQQAMRNAEDRLAGHEGETPAEEHRGGPLPDMKR